MFRSLKLLAPLSVLALVSAAILLSAPIGVADNDAVAGAPTVAGAPSKRLSNVYIVRMIEDPVVAYRGGIKGLRATRPAPGQKIDPRNPDVVRYASYLDSRHNAALAHVGNGRKLYDYRYVFNGFAAQLTPGQAVKMAAAP